MAGGFLNLPTLVQKIRVESDTRDAEDSVARSMTSIGNSISKVGIGLTVGVTAPILGFAAASVSAASDLEESASKVGVVFEENADQIESFAERAATSIGLSEQAALEAAGTFGNLFRALGVGTADAADMSTALVTLAADLASFNNANPEDVLLALRSGLLGEAEPLRQFGVSLSAARIEAEALSSGLVEPIANMTEIAEAGIKVEKANEAAAIALREHGRESLQYRSAALAVTKAEEDLAEATAGQVPELTAAQKAQAAYQIILQDTALAQGDFSRTSDGLANQQRILAAQFADVRASLGRALLPAVQTAVQFFNGLLTSFEGLSPEVQRFVSLAGIAAAALGPVLIVVGQLVRAVGSLGPVFSAVKGLLAGGGVLGLGPALPVIAAVAAAGYLIYRNWDRVRPVLEAVAGGARQIFEVFRSRDFTSGPLSEDSPIILGAFAIRDVITETVIPALGDFVGFLQREVPPVIEGVARVVNDVILPALGEFVGFLRREVPPIVSTVGRYIGDLIGFFQEIGPDVAEAVGHVVAVVRTAFDVVRTIFTTQVNFLRTVFGPVLAFVQALWRAWSDDLLSIVRVVFDVISQTINATLDVIANVIRTVLAVINGDWADAWNGILGILRGVWDGIYAVLEGAIGIVRGILAGIISTFSEILSPVGNFLHTWIVTPFENILLYLYGLPGKISDLATGMWDGVWEAFRDMLNLLIGGWNDLEFQLPSFDGLKVAGRTVIPGWEGPTLGTPDIDPLALGGRSMRGDLNLVGERGPELAMNTSGSAQVFNADRTERLLRSIAGGAFNPGGGDRYDVKVYAQDRRSGQALGRDIAWGIAGTRGRSIDREAS